MKSCLRPLVHIEFNELNIVALIGLKYIVASVNLQDKTVSAVHLGCLDFNAIRTNKGCSLRWKFRILIQN